MPLVHVSLRRSKSPAFRKAILDGIYSAMLTSFDVPEEDHFMTSPSTTTRISATARAISASRAAMIWS